MSCFRFALMALLAWSSAQAQQPNLVLRGTVQGSQNNTYIEVPFDLPAKTQRLTVSFHYTGKEEKTTLDIGMEDPHGFRGWSGGNKSSFTISATDATPSYLPGELIPGTWKLLIGVPNIRPQTIASYEADLFFEQTAAARTDSFTDAPLRRGPGWYRGDLHMHTAHSDGHCKSQTGKQVPCPVFLTLEAARRRGLDFIAVTDHNSTSQYDALRELQPYFDQLLLIPGREITTFVGHANVFGTTDFIDFRVGSNMVPNMNSLFEQAARMGALISINHPGAPTGEVCMGCGWQAPTDMRRVEAIEAVNGGSEEGPYSGVPFWEKQLNAGFRPTAIGGSDNHDASLPPERAGSVGNPTTVVYAPELSVSGILAGIRAGRVFIDLTASKDRLLDFSIQNGTARAVMGGVLHANSGDVLELSAHVLGCEGSRLRVFVDGREDPSLTPEPITSADQIVARKWGSDGTRHWLRADVVSASGKLELLGNPIYVNLPAESH
ncbi:MAG TPA: CehA/McbA family metallohydrolase [Terriglobales bacterium]|nr:CehA/McbA family metallohydrolase [Terriglobales bacterium]